MAGFITIIVALLVFYVLGQIPYWRAHRKQQIVELENERLDIYIEIEDIISNCNEIERAKAYCIVDAVMTNPRKVPFFPVFLLILNKKFRVNYNSFAQKLQTKLGELPMELREKLESLNKIDLKIMINTRPIASTILFIILFWFVMRSNETDMLKAEKSVSELILQKSMARTMPLPT